MSYVLARMRLLSLWSWLRLWRLLQASATFTFAQCLELWAKQNLPSIKLLSSKYLITAEGNETSIWIKVYNRLFCKGWTWWLALNTHHHPVTEAGHRISPFFFLLFYFPEMGFLCNHSGQVFVMLSSYCSFTQFAISKNWTILTLKFTAIHTTSLIKEGTE